MSSIRELDVLVIGATGFTGKHAVKNLVKISKSSTYAFSWGICGRSKEKIDNLLGELEEMGEDKTNIPTLFFDIVKDDDIKKITSKAKILINCTGPNILYSEPIVKACIETGTHYVDISAELFHMISIYRKFNASAEAANVLIIPACGFAVIPVASGLMHLEKNFNGTLTSVECYTELIIPKRAHLPSFCKDTCLVHSGTWQSMVYEWENVTTYRQLKMETYPEGIYDLEPREIKRCVFHKQYGKLWYPYPGPDKDVIEMSQRYLHKKQGKKPYHYRMYATMPAWYHFLLVVPGILLYYFLSYLGCFRNLLRNHSAFFSLGYMSDKGPSEEMARDTKFEMTFMGKGFDVKSDQKAVTVKVTGSDPGYKTTSTTLIIAAMTILEDYAKMPKGGVIHVGAAFQDTKIVENLTRSEVLSFELREETVVVGDSKSVTMPNTEVAAANGNEARTELKKEPKTEAVTKPANEVIPKSVSETVIKTAAPKTTLQTLPAGAGCCCTRGRASPNPQNIDPKSNS